MHAAYLVTVSRLLDSRVATELQTHQPLIRWLAGTLSDTDVTQRATIQRQFRYLQRSLWTECIRPGVNRDLHTGCHLKNRVMAPLSSPLPSLLRHRGCLQKANVCKILQGLHHRPFRSCLWKRNFGAAYHGVGQLLSHQHRAKNYAASVYSSSDGQDMTERLWSIYNETKRQTEGTNAAVTIQLLLFYNPGMTNAPTISTASH